MPYSLRGVVVFPILHIKGGDGVMEVQEGHPMTQIQPVDVELEPRFPGFELMHVHLIRNGCFPRKNKTKDELFHDNF